MNEKTHEAVVTSVKAAPPISAAGALLVGINLDVWVQIAALVYTLFLIGEKLWKWEVPQRLWRWSRLLWSQYGGRS